MEASWLLRGTEHTDQTVPAEAAKASDTGAGDAWRPLRRRIPIAEGKPAATASQKLRSR